MMKRIHAHMLLLVWMFGASCEGQNKPAPSQDSVKSGTRDAPASRWSDTRYEYTDAAGKRLVIQNGLPRGGGKYTDPNGNEYVYAIFWTRIINETDNALEVQLDFPVDSFEPPWLPGKYYKILGPPDTMTIDKETLYDYGLAGLKTFLDSTIHKPSSLKRTIPPGESGGFHVVLLSRIHEGAQGALRTGLRLEGQDLFYRVSLVKGPPPLSLLGEKEIPCGRINLKGITLRK